MAMANSPKPSDAKMSSLPKYGWDEVRKHNSREDCWIVIERTIEGEKRGIILDITQWAPKHPGGSIIYDGAGGDCTIMFWCYHPINFIDNSSSYINKYAVGEVENYNCVYTLDSPLFRTLKRRMEAIIPRKDRCHDARLWWKTALILLCIATFFYLGWARGSIPFIILFGIAMAQSCINIMHDGIHTAYSKHTWVNGLAAWTFNLCGANFLAYRRVHTYGHHAYTCHDEYDSSIPRSYPIVKLHDKLESKWFNKFQHIYVWLVLSLGTVHFWWGDFGEMANFWNYPRRKGHVTPFQWLYVIAGKMIFFYWYFYLQFSWFPWQQALLHCAILQSTSSLTSIVFFAVNHWTDKAVMVSAEDMLKNTKDWVVNQAISSTNFSRKSWFWGHFSGGLNLQIEHHIFPQLVHTRLPDISDMVRETLMEFGIDYDQQCYPTFTSSLWGMYNWLRGVGCDYPLKPYPKISDPQPLVEKKKHA